MSDTTTNAHSHAFVEDDGGDASALAETLIALAERVGQALDCSECCVYEYLPAQDALRAQAVWSRIRLTQRDRDWIGQINRLNEMPGFDRVIAEGSLVVTYPEDTADAAMQGMETMQYWGELTALYAPITIEGEVVGILELTEKRIRRDFSDADKALIMQMASLASVALLNARRSRRHQLTNRRLSALLSASRTLSSTVDVDEVLALVCKLATEALDAPCAYIYEHDADLDGLIWRGQHERSGVPAAEEPFGTVYLFADYEYDREIVETNEVRQARMDDPELSDAARAVLQEFEEAALLSVPLRYSGEIVGLLEIAEDQIPRRFSENEIALAGALGDQAAAAIHNAKLFRRLQEQNEHVQEQNRHMAALLDSSRAIGSSVMLDEVLQHVGEQVAAALRSQSCYIYEYDAATDSIIWRSYFHDDPAFIPEGGLGEAYPLSDFPWDQATIRRRQASAVSVGDQDIDPGQRAELEKSRILTQLTVPLLFGDELVGLMELAETREERQYTDDEIDLARAIGEQAGLAIRNAQLYRREMWRSERLVRVLEISRAVGSSLEATEVTEGLCAQVGRLFADDPATVSVNLLAGAEASAIAAAAGDSLITTSLTQMAPTQQPAGAGHRLVVPLTNKGQAVGYIDILAGGSGFAEDEIELVQLLANQAAAAVDNARLYETIEKQAVTDGLTGLYNHRYFFERLRAEVTRSKRYGHSLSVLMIDLDDFKSFNDRFGHPAGDLVLHTAAGLIAGQLRKDLDLPARYGGEEFAVILPHTPGFEEPAPDAAPKVHDLNKDSNGARVVAERIRSSLAANELLLEEGGAALRVTSSVGVATMPAQAVDADDLVSKADQALYMAKKLGKDRVEVFRKAP